MTYRPIVPLFSIFDEIAKRPLAIDLADISNDDQAVKCCPIFETEDDALVFAEPMEEASLVKHTSAAHCSRS